MVIWICHATVQCHCALTQDQHSTALTVTSQTCSILSSVYQEYVPTKNKLGVPFLGWLKCMRNMLPTKSKLAVPN